MQTFLFGGHSPLSLLNSVQDQEEWHDVCQLYGSKKKKTHYVLQEKLKAMFKREWEADC